MLTTTTPRGPTSPARPPHQAQMPFMQVTHGRHETDAPFLGLPAFGQPLHGGGGLHYSHNEKVVYHGQSINIIVIPGRSGQSDDTSALI
jgi:hypothetical protein